MNLMGWIFIQLLPALGFILALFLMAHVIRSRRSTGSVFAWLLVIVLAPYIGVPLYIFFGGRKIKQLSDKKEHLVKTRKRPDDEKKVHALFFDDTEDELFEPSSGNSIELLLDGEDTFHELIKRLKEAKKTIYIMSYILGNDETGKEILRVLTKKAAEGLQVCLLLDALGSFKKPRSEFQLFKKAGGHLCFFMPVFGMPFTRKRANLRNHRKIVLIDNETAIVGGMNLATEYMGYEEDDSRWCDLSLLIQGPAIDDIYEVFRSDWKFASDDALPAIEAETQPLSVGSTTSLQIMPSGPDVDGDFLHEAIITSIFKAQNRIWIAMPYFVPDEMLLMSLCIAARRGVDVRLILPFSSNHPLADFVRRTYLNDIQKAGGNVFYYKPRMMHGKLILIDNGVGITGSANMDMRSMFLNYEIAIFVYTPSEVLRLEKWLNGLLKESIKKEDHVSFMRELIEGAARLLAPLL